MNTARIARTARLELLTTTCAAFERIITVADVPDIMDARRTIHALGTSFGLALGQVFGEERAGSMARIFIDGLLNPR